MPLLNEARVQAPRRGVVRNERLTATERARLAAVQPAVARLQDADA